MTGVAVGVSPGFGRSVGRYSPQASGADSLSEQAGFEPAVPPLENPRSDARRGFPSSIALALPPSEFDTPRLRRERDRWFADSPLEGTGFEPSVPRDGRQVFDNKPEIPDLVCQIVNRTKSSTVLQAIM